MVSKRSVIPDKNFLLMEHVSTVLHIPELKVGKDDQMLIARVTNAVILIKSTQQMELVKSAQMVKFPTVQMSMVWEQNVYQLMLLSRHVMLEKERSQMELAQHVHPIQELRNGKERKMLIVNLTDAPWHRSFFLMVLVKHAQTIWLQKNQLIVLDLPNNAFGKVPGKLTPLI